MWEEPKLLSVLYDSLPSPTVTRISSPQRERFPALSLRQWSEDSRALVGSDDGSLSLWRLDSSECLVRRICAANMLQ